MKVIPAIDIKGGKVVRLIQGDIKRVTVYSDSPVDIAKIWASEGAQLIHVVDLDGAFKGELKNFDIVKRMAKAVNAKIELGGGIRDIETLRMVLSSGVERAIIGTKALDEDFLAKVAQEFNGRVAVGIDSKDGVICTRGWLFKTKIKASYLAKKIKGLGINSIIYTDISKDGMLSGPGFAGLKELLTIRGMNLIASGGVSSIEDIKKLKLLETDGLKGVIIGKALYEGTIDLREAIKLC